LDLALKHLLLIRRLTIFTDNQAAIQAVAKPRNHSGQYLVHGVRERLQTAQMLGIQAAIHWVPSHVDIDGNEQADILAKMATGWREGEGKTGPKAPTFPSL
jgi:ribonuclease HI